MAWQTVAEADNLETLGDDVTEDTELVKGTKIRFVMDLAAPVGYAFNLAGAEYIFRPFMPDGIDLIDVHANGWWGAVIECQADPAWLIAVLAFVKAHWLAITLGTIGLAWALSELISSIRCDVDKGPLANIATIAKWGAIGLLGVLAIKLITTFKEAKT